MSAAEDRRRRRRERAQAQEARAIEAVRAIGDGADVTAEAMALADAFTAEQADRVRRFLRRD